MTLITTPAAQIMTSRSTFSKRLDLLAKQGLIRGFTSVVFEAEGSDDTPDNARRVWVTINELKADDWGIGGHTDWLRDYTSALDDVGDYKKPP
jgi:phenylpyruvate tautomerase PptA (4-oxalocrotonate tautomerase family)